MRGAELLDVEMAQSTKQIILMIFLIIGVGGFVTALGLWWLKRWGYWGTLLLSVATIIFDVWGFTIQFTAAIGIILRDFHPISVHEAWAISMNCNEKVYSIMIE